MKATSENQAACFLELARTRRSIRRYRAEPVPSGLVNELLEAARWAPSAHNRQPWRFAVIRGVETKRALARAMGAQLRADLERDGARPETIEADASRSYARITGAPVVIVVSLSMREMDSYPDERRQQAERTMAVQSVAMAVQNMLLAAHARGLGACWMCAPLFVPAIVRAALGLADDWEPQALVTLGFPAEEKTKARRPLEDVAIYLDGD